ncbi:glycoside hydrolase family 131 protein [Cadophora sp. DSE1049]|nr:glycoside hydrolase family 131 protein [Cadophora sp. DSE1049]
MAILTASLVALLTAALISLSEAAPRPKSAITCPITLDGRVSQNITLGTFDTAASPFNPDYTKGQNLTWSQILRFPCVSPSKFDVPFNRALEVTISDASIFVPGGGQQQVGFRRAGMLLGNGSDASNIGVQTYHWSVMQPEDKKGRMNLTHEYMNVWHETNDYSSNHFSLNAGVMLDQDKPKEGTVTTTGLDKRLWKILDRKNNVIWTTKIEWEGWQNFAIKLDYEKNTIQVFYSTGYDKLKAVTKALPNDNTGGGQYQIGVLKKPTETVSVVFDGYQEGSIDEGQIYGGIFIENSGKECFSK